ncbi:hypothetical protein EV121DRAFT_297205 [Schizophyllum commune]
MLIVGYCDRQQLRALLKVDKRFRKISRPLFFREIALTTPRNATLLASDELAGVRHLVRRISVQGVATNVLALAPVLPRVVSIQWHVYGDDDEEGIRTFLTRLPSVEDVRLGLHATHFHRFDTLLGAVAEQLVSLHVESTSGWWSSGRMDPPRNEYSRLRTVSFGGDIPFDVADFLYAFIVHSAPEWVEARLPRFCNGSMFGLVLHAASGTVERLALQPVRHLDLDCVRRHVVLDALKHLEFEAHDLNNDTRWEWSFASDVLSRIGHAAATPHLETIRFTVYARNASENSLSGDGYAALFPDDLMFFKGPENCWESLAQCVTVRGAALYLIVFTPYPKSSCRLQSLENQGFATP